ncbi:MAG: ABC transporter substrate-binding protein [Labilithrix sp.]|nr:ABC transporter substrate-binding protein [Labilithrix sp.]
MKRRTFLAGIAGVAATAAVGGAAIARSDGRPSIRVGVMANLTHAPLLAGLGSGRVARALAPVRVESRLFRGGPRVTEALIGDAIDVGTAGPAAVVVHHARHAGGSHGLRVLGGCASGGASLVVTARSRVVRPSDLAGKRLAVTQIGTTQDVALRHFIAAHGLRDAAAGGDVRVVAIAPATILAQMGSGDLDGAWLPEPWATRLVRELGAIRFVDERDLWEAGRFSTAILVTRRDRASDPRVTALAAALRDEVERSLRDPATTREEAYAELRRHLGNPGKRVDFDEAWRFMEMTNDPLRASIEAFASRAASLGLCPSGGAGGLFGERS